MIDRGRSARPEACYDETRHATGSADRYRRVFQTQAWARAPQHREVEKPLPRRDVVSVIREPSRFKAGQSPKEAEAIRSRSIDHSGMTDGEPVCCGLFPVRLPKNIQT